ncbi:Eco57I restriction-modification methylase domain-containing protein [Natronolimnohabitans sp. A-GB9]|uniref:Eco57I restriction-modification methylase domain-containing protein n=1 Tax=Natronolimnohabitans sp. A-GB9 TaxID=3069757 RepID=UPI0027B507B3|nr:DNA methyltransferase [Natronolimnohabitans sp. A-GB9]MDQ2050741.1 Eco57I restriction-modification methylase domain-containing protein [Natronolimnohabitans sp. A-GB9]
MQQALTYRTNRDLFSNYYLDEHLPETEEWDEVSDEELEEAYDDIMDLWEREKSTAPKRNESQLEEKFIRPMFRKLGIPFEVEESTSRTQKRPDYGFFESDDAARNAFERREEGGDFYKNAVAVADAKRWGRPLDTRGSGKHERDFENPSYQIHVYLQETPARWAVLTDGKKWRLYYGPTSHRLDSYYEVDLATILESGDLEDFKYFYLFFRHEAFLKDASGDCFLDDVYGESNVFAQELGEDLQDNIYEAIKILSEGFLQYPENDLNEDDLELIHDSSLIYLYRLIFVLYAEAEGRDLLDTDNEIYEEQYSLNNLKQVVAEELDSGNPTYRDWQDNLWDQLDGLFKLIDKGSKSRGIPEEDLYIPAYNGGLFRTDTDAGDSPEAQFLAEYKAGDAYLAKVIDLLTRSEDGNGGGKIFVDYSSLDVRHLGSIYEGLLEYQLNVADEPLALEDGEYVIPDEGDDVVVEEGEVYLTTDSGERKATGSYYTPEYVVEYIVENTLGPIVEDIRMDLAGQSAYDEGGFAEEFAERIFELKILDPAMGSGHFLTSAIDYLAREIIDAQEKQAAQQGIETVDEEHDINWARRQVAQRCIYGVDLNPLAVELAKVSLWLRTLAAEQPLAFLDHHLKAGNSLVGSDIETVLDNGDPDADIEEGQLTLQESFDRTRRQALEHVTDQFEDLLAIDNETLDDIKEMEAVYEQVRDDPLYQHLIAMANVHTAEQSGLDVPDDAYERMAEALRDDSWIDIEDQDWYCSAQAMAKNQNFFHWELEFPIAFYQQDGEIKEESGFDAVIGNPPYVGEKERKETFELLKNCSIVKECYQGRMDMLYFFVLLGIKLSNSSGTSSMITTSYWPEANSAENLRNEIAKRTSIREILEFDGFTVFNQAPGQENLIYKFDNSGSENITFSYICSDKYGDNAVAESLLGEKDLFYQETYNYEEFDLPSDGSEWYGIKGLAKGSLELPDTGQTFSDFLESKQGIVPNPDKVTKQSYEDYENEDVEIGEGVFLLDDDDLERIGISEDHQLLKPAYSNSDISKYHIGYPDNLYVLYVTSSVDIDQYPQIEKHLNRYRSKLEDRREVKNDKISWYSLQWPRNKQLFETPKIVYSNWGNDWQPYAVEDQEYYERRDITLLKPLDSEVDLYRLTAILNSRVSEYWQTEQRSRTGYTTQESLDDMPIAPNLSEVDSETDESLQELAKRISDLKNQRTNLNLNLFDYLGIPTDELPESKTGGTLADLQMPLEGVANTPLTKTTDEYDGLRIEDVFFKDDNGRLVLSVDISYKVEEDDPRETDRWDRLTESEFETYEAMAFIGLSDAEETLLCEFVPVAVEKAEGFAGFRQGATQTNSPLDRLKDLTLPDIDEIQTGLEQYTKVRKRADELEEKIEKVDQQINEIVYDLYGLTDEEIEIVESAVKDD